MANNTSIEMWTREQCEDYLKQYPKSLKSEAVRKRLNYLAPKQHLDEQRKVSSAKVTDVLGSVAQTKDDTRHIPETSSSKTYVKPQSTLANPQKQTINTTNVDKHERDMDVVGKVILSVLVFGLCAFIIWIIKEIGGVDSTIYSAPCCAVVGIPLLRRIWK